MCELIVVPLVHIYLHTKMLHCLAAFNLRDLMFDRPLSGAHNRRFYSFCLL